MQAGICWGLVVVVCCQLAAGVDGAAGSSFTPDSISDLIWRMESSDVNQFQLKSYSGDVIVRRWYNKLEEDLDQGDREYFEGDNNKRRPFMDSVDGFPCARFDGDSDNSNPDHLEYKFGRSDLSPDKPFTWFLVLKAASGQGGVIGSMDIQSSSNAAAGWELSLNQNDVVFTLFTGNGQRESFHSNNPAPIGGGFFLIAIRKVDVGPAFDVQLSVMDDSVDYVSEEIVKSEWVQDDNDPPQVVLGCRKNRAQTVTKTFEGWMAEFLLYTRALSDNEFDCVSNRLRCYYNMVDTCDYSLDEVCTDFVPTTSSAPEEETTPPPVELPQGCDLSGPMDSCCEGYACTRWTMSKVSGDARACDEEWCEWEVCMTYDPTLPGCSKDGAIGHRCAPDDPSASTSCRAPNESPMDDGWNGFALVEDAAQNAAFTDCQQGRPGTTLYFATWDEACGAAAGNWELDATTGTNLTCSQSESVACGASVDAGAQCMWTVTVPACGSEPPEETPPEETPAASEDYTLGGEAQLVGVSHADVDDAAIAAFASVFAGTLNKDPSQINVTDVLPLTDGMRRADVGVRIIYIVVGFGSWEEVTVAATVIQQNTFVLISNLQQEPVYAALAGLYLDFDNDAPEVGVVTFDNDPNCPIEGEAQSLCEEQCHYLAQCMLVTAVGTETNYKGECDDSDWEATTSESDNDRRSGRRGSSNSDSDGGSSGSGTDSGSDKKYRKACEHSKGRGGSSGSSSSETNSDSGSSGFEGSSGWSSGSDTDFDPVFVPYKDKVDLVPRWQCVCPPGLFGNGTHCSTTAWAVRTVVTVESGNEACKYVGSGCGSGSDTDGSSGGGAGCSDGDDSESGNSEVDGACEGNQDEYCFYKCLEHHSSPATPCWKAFCNNGNQCSMSPHTCCAFTSNSDSGSDDDGAWGTDSSGSDSSGLDDEEGNGGTCVKQSDCLQFRFTQKPKSKCGAGAVCEWEVCMEVDTTAENCGLQSTGSLGHTCEAPYECDHTSGEISNAVNENNGYTGNPWFLKEQVQHGYKTCQVGSAGSKMTFLLNDGNCEDSQVGVGSTKANPNGLERLYEWAPDGTQMQCRSLEARNEAESDNIDDCVDEYSGGRRFSEAFWARVQAFLQSISNGGYDPGDKEACVWEITLPECGEDVPASPPVLTGFKSQCPCTAPAELPPEAQILVAWPRLSLSYSNWLLNGEDALTHASLEASRTSYHHVLRNCNLNTTSVTVNQFFASEAEATAAAAALQGDHSSRVVEMFAREMGVEPATVTVVAGATTELWNAGLDCDPVQAKGTGFEVTGVEFDWTCASTGCWRIDVEYFRGDDTAVNVLYLPRTDGDDQQPDGGGYPPEVYAQYEVRNFPCSVEDIGQGELQKRHTPCCLEDFVAQYRTLAEFEAWVERNAQLKLCPSSGTDYATSAPSSNLLISRNQSTPDATGIISGSIPDMPNSRVVPTGVLDLAKGKYGLQLELDEVELRNRGGMIKGVAGVKHDIETFVGMAYLNPTNTRVMDSFTRQTFLTLERTNFFSLATAGTNDYSFLEYLNLRLHEVYAEDGSDNRLLQYVTVTFTLPQAFRPNPTTSIIPLSSIRIGKGLSRAGASYVNSCQEAEADVWGAEVQTAYEDRLAQLCAPAAQLCKPPAFISDRFVSVSFPMGYDFFDSRASGWSSGQRRVFVEFDVTVLDDSGADSVDVKTRVSTVLTVMSGGVNSWCASAGAQADLSSVANADLLVGSVETEGELTRLRIFEDIAGGALAPQVSTQVDTDSIESGLMTLVVRGDPGYFSLERNVGARLELEDLITLHIMESGSVLYDEVRGLVRDGTAFELEVDARDHTMHLTPSDALSYFCAFRPARPTVVDPFPTSCVVRRDVERRLFPQFGTAPPTAVELPAAGGDLSGVVQFMSTIFTDSDYAARLARAFAPLIADRYGLNGQYARAWWVNPGYEWAPAQVGEEAVFSLSQRVVMVGLIKLNDAAGARRSERMVVHGVHDAGGGRRAVDEDGAPYGEGIGQLDLEFNVNSGLFVAMTLNVEPKRVTTWFVAMLLTDEQACMDSLALRVSLGETMVGYLVNSASEVQHAMVTSVRVDRGSVDCAAAGGDGEARRNGGLQWYSGASASMELAVVFKDATALINLKLLGQMSGVIEVEPVLSYNNVVVDNQYVPGGVAAAPPSESSGPPVNLLVTAIVGAGCGVLLAVCGACVWRRSSRREMEREREQVLAAAQAKDPRDEEEGGGMYKEPEVLQSVPLQEIKQQLKSEILYDLTPVGSTPPPPRDSQEELAGKGVERRIFSHSFSSFAAFGLGRKKDAAAAAGAGAATAGNSPLGMRGPGKKSREEEPEGSRGAKPSTATTVERERGSGSGDSGGASRQQTARGSQELEPEEPHPTLGRKQSREGSRRGPAAGSVGRRSGRSGRSGRRRYDSPSESEDSRSEGSVSSRSRSGSGSRSDSRSGSGSRRSRSRSPSPGDEAGERTESYMMEMAQQRRQQSSQQNMGAGAPAPRTASKPNLLLF